MNCQGLNDIEGLQFIPVNGMKQPIVKGWQTSKDKHDLSNVVYVGLVCGEPSLNLECLDIDLKYSLDPKLFDKYKKLVNSVNDGLLKKLVVQKTRSGGYHLIYRCTQIAGNLKLANRRTTEEEKSDTYKKTYDYEISKSTDDDKAKKVAERAAANDKVRVLFETRGIGGQFVVEPSEGYKFVFGDLQSISFITPEERETLHGIARQFNEVVEEISIPKVQQKKTKGLSSFEDYNERGDVVALLESYGWRIVTQKGSKTVFLRPGQTTSQSSGNYDHDKKWFSVFTTSTEFEPQHAYLPYAVYALLECNKDFSLASKKLYESGYGDREETITQKEPEKKQSTRQIPSRINSEDEDYSFLAKPEDYEGYLQQVIDGTLPMGLTTGCPSLDEFFLFKEGNLVIINGTDGTGKSVFIWWLMMIAAMYHGWKGIIFSSENTLGSFMRKMIQYYWGKQLPRSSNYAMNDMEYKIARKFVEDHFTLIKAQEDLYNYKDIINMIKKTRKMGNYKYAMIDPYNSLKIDLSGYSKLNTHEYHYEGISEIKAYGQKNNFGWYVNMHAVTAAARAKDGEKKYPIAPLKADTEGGQKFANKADDFLTVHRVVGHPTEWMITELHVRKIKETDTGGRPTPFDNPIKFEMYKGGTAFLERLETGGNPVDPIQLWHNKNEPKQQKIELPPTIVSTWKPYKDNDGEETTF